MNVWTVLGIWIDDDPVPVGVVQGDHVVYGGEAAHDYQGPWATRQVADTATEAERQAVEEMRATLDNGSPSERDAAAIEPDAEKGR